MLNLTIEKVIAALRRSTHLKPGELRRDYPELFEIEQETRLKEIALNTKLFSMSIIAEIRGLACPIKR